MDKTVEVIYENGVFKPLQKVDLKDGTKLRIRLESLSELDEFCGLIESKITLKEIKELRCEVKTWRR